MNIEKLIIVVSFGNAVGVIIQQERRTCICTMSNSHDGSLLSKVTEALQSQERLYLELKKHGEDYSPDILCKSKEALLDIRDIKAEVEGSHEFFSPCVLNQAFLQELRQLMLMHIPSSITEDVRKKFESLLLKTFHGGPEKLLFAVLLTCPWYEAVQRERGEQARHNVIFAVFLSPDGEVLAPVSKHVHEQANVIDLGWLYANELYHFNHFLVKGKTRCVEALFCRDQAVLYEDRQWRQFRRSIEPQMIIGLGGFLEACQGQAVGGIGKKGRDGQFRMNDSTTFQELCSSFRLMHHAYNAANTQPPCTGPLDIDSLPEHAKTGANKLKAFYEKADFSKKDIFDVLVKWKEQTQKLLTGFAFTNPKEVEGIVGRWQMETRLGGRSIDNLKYQASEDTKLQQMMQKIGGTVGSLSPDQILLIARAGSFMYGLSMPKSDIDYVIVYADKTENILSTCAKKSESFESRGPDKNFEYGAYEARLLCEMILKGSVVILELLFTDDHEYISPAWKKLASEKKLFLTEKLLQQYLGLIRNNFDMIESRKCEGTPKERKLFYQIWHKLDSLSYLLKGQCPPIRCEGEMKDFIMKIRRGPLEGDIEREHLYATTKGKFETFLESMAKRNWRFRENMDYNFITAWLMSVRGIQTRT
ncbi:hypothetical protein ScPMuIL_002726 [Solemya velum]